VAICDKESKEQNIQETESEANKTGNEEELNKLSNILSVE